MAAEFTPLSPQGDYTITSSDGTSMDDVSLASSRVASSSRPPPSSSSASASVSSKFSRRSVKNTSLGVPLASSLELDETDGNDEGNGPAAPAESSGRGGFLSEDDPFHMFRADLGRKLTSVDEELDKYLTAVRTTDTAANSHAIKEIKKQLKRHVKHAESTLRDLETTVRVVERGREKFPHIRDAELAERRRFVDDAKDRLARAKTDLQSDEVKQKLVRDERALTERRRAQKKGRVASAPPGDRGASGAAKGGYGPARDLEEGGSNGIGESDDPERAETLMMMRQQDETLDGLDAAVTRVGYMAETIHEEIETQNVMLKDLEEDLADAEEQLGVVMGKLAKLLKTKSKCQIGLIVALSLIVLVLFFLVIYT
ncbi:hypothetical protein ACHAWF_003596 [Thalassiosira exigua]